MRAVGTRTRRRDRRLHEPPLTVALQGLKFATVDWSLGGFRIGGYRGQAKVGEQLAVNIFGQIAGRLLGGTAIATVVRRDFVDRELAASFTEFRSDTWDQLEQLSVRRVRRA
ncbi:MAG: hypothetical protein RIM84_08430 [Alphaproteobacteria bacterium]